MTPGAMGGGEVPDWVRYPHRTWVAISTDKTSWRCLRCGCVREDNFTKAGPVYFPAKSGRLGVMGSPPRCRTVSKRKEKRRCSSR